MPGIMKASKHKTDDYDFDAFINSKIKCFNFTIYKSVLRKS